MWCVFLKIYRNLFSPESQALFLSKTVGLFAPNTIDRKAGTFPRTGGYRVAQAHFLAKDYLNSHLLRKRVRTSLCRSKGSTGGGIDNRRSLAVSELLIFHYISGCLRSALGQ